MELQNTNINTNSFTVGGKIEKIQVISTKAGGQYLFGTLLNEYYKEGLQFPIRTYVNFKCFSDKCIEMMKTLSPGSTAVINGYYVSEYYLNKNKEKIYDKYMFIEKVKVLSNGKKPAPADPAVFSEEDLPF